MSARPAIIATSSTRLQDADRRRLDVARVQASRTPDPWAKAGVRFARPWNPARKHAFACVTRQWSRLAGPYREGGASFNTGAGRITARTGEAGSARSRVEYHGFSFGQRDEWAPVTGSNPTNIPDGFTVLSVWL